MTIPIAYFHLRPATKKYAIKRADGMWLCSDGRGIISWDLASWDRSEGTKADMQAIIASYAPSTQRKLRLVAVD
jgi:hypothetical protein